MPEIELSPKQRQDLKARAHSVKPVVLLGQSGLSAAVLKEIDRALVLPPYEEQSAGATPEAATAP